MATQMQRAFARSIISRRIAAETAALDGLRAEGNKRLMNEIVADLLGNVPETKIKFFLYGFLMCYDISPEERQAAFRLLDLAQTALTAKQIRAAKQCSIARLIKAIYH